MNAAGKRTDVAARVVARSAKNMILTGHGSPRLRSSYHEDVNEVPSTVDHEPVDVETEAPLIWNTAVEGWNSDAVDAEAEFASKPDE